MHRSIILVCGLVTTSLLACGASESEDVGSSEAAATTGNDGHRECFAATTGQAIGADQRETASLPARQIAAYWRANGGTTRLGLPISPLLDAKDESNHDIRVQWFERARLEFHPALYSAEHPSFRNGVLEGRLGAEYVKKIGLVDAAGTSKFSCGVSSPKHRTEQTEYHRETSCTIFGLSSAPSEVTLSNARPVVVDAQPNFLAYYRANGGLEHFGHPISEQIDMEGASAQDCQQQLHIADGDVANVSETCKVLLSDPQVKPYRLAPLSEVEPDAGFGDVDVAVPNTVKYVQYFERGRLEYQPANIKWSERDLYGTKRVFDGRVYFVGARELKDDYTVQVGLFGVGLAPQGPAQGDAFLGWPRCQ